MEKIDHELLILGFERTGFAGMELYWYSYHLDAYTLCVRSDGYTTIDSSLDSFTIFDRATSSQIENLLNALQS